MRLTDKLGNDGIYVATNFTPKEFDYVSTTTISTVSDCIKKDNFDGPDFYCIGTFEEPVYFNRYFSNDTPISDDERGVKSINFNHTKKLGVDVLLPVNSVCIIAKIKEQDDFHLPKILKASNFTSNSIMEIVLKYGGDLNKLHRIGNDYYYNGKKFCGNEMKVNPYGYGELTVITCKYLPEKEWFDKLNNPKKEITGITEEIPELTQEIFIKELEERAREFFGGL